MLVEHHCKLYLAIPVLVRGNLRYFLIGAVHWLAQDTVGVLRESAFLMNFTCELPSCKLESQFCRGFCLVTQHRAGNHKTQVLILAPPVNHSETLVKLVIISYLFWT